MFNQSGIYEGVSWSVVHQGGKIFSLTVGDKTESYECSYEPIFGLDVMDQQAINVQLDRMQGLEHNVPIVKSHKVGTVEGGKQHGLQS